jgi:phenylacetate-CoA ligase
VFFAFSFGPFIGFWLAFESAQKLGCLCIPGGGMSSEARGKAILLNGATVLCCTPTYAIHLGQVATQANNAAGKSQVETIIVAGEPGGSIPATRRRIENLWPGARVFDHHGMTETGPVTYECPMRPGVLHVIESAYFAEVVDPATGQPAPEGELVLSTLGRTGSPLLRYRTGDLVKRGTACACGRHDISLAGGILGRVDDMIIVRGVNVYPAAIEEILRGFGEIAEYRVRVSSAKALTELRLEIEPVPQSTKTASLAEDVAGALATALALRVPVEIVPPGSLPRFELKARRWITG